MLQVNSQRADKSEKLWRYRGGVNMLQVKSHGADKSEEDCRMRRGVYKLKVNSYRAEKNEEVFTCKFWGSVYIASKLPRSRQKCGSLYIRVSRCIVNKNRKTWGGFYLNKIIHLTSKLTKNRQNWGSLYFRRVTHLGLAAGQEASGSARPLYW